MRDTWKIGSWRVNLQQGWFERRYRFGARRVHPDARLLQVLKVLVENAGEIVSTENILRAAWSDRVVSRDSVTTAIYQLRQLLGDNTVSPKYISSEPRRGYRLIATAIPAQQARPLRLASGLVASLAVAALAGWTWVPAAATPSYIYVLPMQNYDESPVQEPLFLAIESTFLSELIQTVPGRVRINDGDDVALRLESMMVACDLGPTLVMRLLDTRSDTYVWSDAYNLEEVAASTERPTLVQQAAFDVGAAIP
jgi:DNA-binding winged helix-turn-helix (wHTH) protein